MTQDIKKIISILHPFEIAALPNIVDAITFDNLKTKIPNLKDIEVMRAIQWLENKEIIKTEKQIQTFFTITEEGKSCLKQGLPEKRLLKAIKESQLAVSEIEKKANLSKQEINASIGVLRRSGSINLKKQEDLIIEITEKGKEFLKQNEVEDQLKKYETPQKEKNKNLITRGLIKEEISKTITIYLTVLGKKIKSQKITPVELIGTLTSGMLKTGSWKNKNFRAYDVEINVPKLHPARRHPYSEANNIVRDVFLQMGFKEMSGPWVETCFWCMDSMWIAQDHPMRDIQDTFYLNKKGDLPKDKEMVERVKQTHENGWETGSKGHGGKWNPEDAKQLILRAHSTATTFRQFGINKLNEDCKYFYIANNFRNETADATHLLEFPQAEGFIMGDNLTLADLMGFIKEFYAKLGIHKIRFKPAFNPYTEPSMEAHYYDEKKKKWFALINSGIFRPETLLPYGIKKTVIAWGMGMIRIAAILNNKHDVRELVGARCNLNWLRTHKVPMGELK